MLLRVLGLVCCLSWPASAFAQTAAGLPSFDEGPFLATIGFVFTEATKGFGAGFAGGSDELFAGVGVGYTSVDEVDLSATSFGLHVGSSLELDSGTRTYMAPVAAIAYSSGPDIGPIDVSIFTIRGGVRVGFLAHEADDIGIVPTAGLDIAYDRLTSDIDIDASDVYGILRLGVGFVFNRRISLLPVVSVPFGVEGDSDGELAIIAAFNFGR